jgi:hypothetical protein
MITYETLKTKPGLLKSFTGLSHRGFKRLKVAFTTAYAEDLVKREDTRGAPRRRGAGGGRRGALGSLENKLVFILFYFKYYPVQVVQGYFFGMGQPQANEWLHRLTPLLNQALGDECQLPARPTQTAEEVLKTYPGLQFIIDGTERPVRRPKDASKQRQYYSGKKKRHTVKNNIVSDKRTGKIKVLSPTVPGKQHDKSLADEQKLIFPPGSQLWKDTGFQGYEPSAVMTFQPKKKPQGAELSASDKRLNTQISQGRLGVEHTLGGVKVFHIVAQPFCHHFTPFIRLGWRSLASLHPVRAITARRCGYYVASVLCPTRWHSRGPYRSSGVTVP